MKKITEAVDALQEFIMKKIECKPKPDEVTVYTYQNHGVRIAEISLVWQNANDSGMGGCSYMRCEFPQLILACEEFLITYGIKPYRPLGWSSDIDIHDDARYWIEKLLNEKEEKKSRKKK